MKNSNTSENRISEIHPNTFVDTFPDLSENFIHPGLSRMKLAVLDTKYRSREVGEVFEAFQLLNIQFNTRKFWLQFELHMFFNEAGVFLNRGKRQVPHLPNRAREGEMPFCVIHDEHNIGIMQKCFPVCLSQIKKNYIFYNSVFHQESGK